MTQSSDHRLVIAPFLLGQFYCDAALTDSSVCTENDASMLCYALGVNGGTRINQFLDAIGPRTSPSGRYSLGYTLNIPLLRYFRKGDDGWHLDEGLLTHDIHTIEAVDRDVVIYLSANHFTDANVPLVRELAGDPANLMWNRDGPLAPDDYFNHPIVAWTLSNYSAPITRMREQAFRAAAAAINALSPAARARIVGISVLGEVHDMFPNFVDGPSQFMAMTRVTDLSPLNCNGFRVWLSQRFGTTEALNRDIGSSFETFDAITPPSVDLNRGEQGTVFNHVDINAAGVAPITGWIYDRQRRPMALDIYVDGELLGQAETGLSRTDVAEMHDYIEDPNVGFRFDLDYRGMSHGRHAIEILVRIPGLDPYYVQRIEVDVEQVGGRPPEHPPQLSNICSPLPVFRSNLNLSGHVDVPYEHGKLIFNPLARLWLEYRNAVVRNYFQHFVNILIQGGIERERVFSHQIAPNLYGSWLSDIVAIDAMQDGKDQLAHGVTLYGGTSFGAAFDRMAEEKGWRRYGVNEMHPIVPLEPDEYRAMFEKHRDAGAVFVGPYYMSMLPYNEQSGTDLDRFLISSRNSRCGSDQYWAAIADIMTK
ncbi:hypothetical protein J3E64_000164 [Sphingobium sp. OAS761]|uniref:hypothetical protein n=1 Tax=Sphingobium sp. OAS761 TaxID=2817901 RepID=UPI00209E69C3|nr:hypothetical protein [Sphingobium sp. OAS761]MCP1468497.1 hypothetical protein [Sphingobium sp. OAS761]